MCKAPVRAVFKLEPQRRTAEGRGPGRGRKAFPLAHASSGAVEGFPGHTPQRPEAHGVCLPWLPSEPLRLLEAPPAQQTCGSQQPCLSASIVRLSCRTQGGRRRRKGHIEAGSGKETEGRSLGSREEKRKGEKKGRWKKVREGRRSERETHKVKQRTQKLQKYFENLENRCDLSERPNGRERGRKRHQLGTTM